MDHDENDAQEEVDSASDESGTDSVHPITIATSDSEIENAFHHPSDGQRHPDTTMRIETTQAHEPNPLYVPGVRQVVVQDPQSRQGGHSAGGQSNQNGTGGNRDPGKGKQQDSVQKPSHGRSEHDGGRDQRDGDPGQDEQQDRSRKSANRPKSGPSHQRQGPSTTKSILMTAGIALVAGLVGAVGYSYMVGPKSHDSSSAQSKGGDGASSKAGSGSSSGSKGGSGS